MGFADDIRNRARQAAQWAFDSEDDVPFDELSKALEGGGLAEPTEEKPRALFHDPYSTMDWGGWRQRPSAMTYETLRGMAVSNSIVASILSIRTNQVAQFARPQQGVYDKGYRVILRDRRDGSRQMTAGEQKLAGELEAMLETTGILLPDERPSDRDSFSDFVKKGTRDILTYDQWTYEKIRDRTGKVSRFVALPSETVRPAVSDMEHMDPAQLRDRVSHVQVYDNTIIAEFGVDDISWNIMNPRSDLRVNGFGFSPLEQMVRLVTAWLYGFEYNSRFFTQGSAIKGVLNIKGAIPDRQLRAFRRMWYSMVSGVQNAWKTPILNSEDIQWISMHANNREMEYGQWMDYVTKLTCSIYGIDAVELGFNFGGSTGGGDSMFTSRPNAQEVIESKDKGLIPLTQHIATSINQNIIWEMAPELEFAFAGLDAKAEGKERERRQLEVKAWKTVDEIRAEQDMDPLPEGKGEIILDPTYLQFVQGMEAEAGEGGEDLGDGEDDGSEDSHEDADGDSFGDGEDFGDAGDDEFGGDDGGDGFDKSRRVALAVSHRVTTELRKATREHTVDGGVQRITVKGV